jgi:hypothetical protein
LKPEAGGVGAGGVGKGAKLLLDPYGELFAKLGPELRGLESGELESGGGRDRDRERLAEIRRKLVWAFSWAVPSPEAVRAISEVGPLIEIGAGTGYWAWLLKQAGVDIIAFDRAPDAPPHWTEVSRGGPERIGEHPGRSLFLCWPPMGETMAAQCLERFRGERVVSIGEAGEGARTGDARFRSLLAERFELEREVAIPQWPGYSDRVRVYLKRS